MTAVAGTLRRVGLVYRPTGAPWHLSHCQNPFVQPLTGDRLRIHFACRDEKNRSRGGWAELELVGSALKVVRAASQPSLELGRMGAFDDSGAMPSSIIEDGDRLLLFYTGWTLARTVPFSFFIGAAESRDGGESFQRVSEAPVLGRNRHDPFLTGAPWVMCENGVLRMWYISGTGWVPGEGESGPVHYYSVKHATSGDGLAWETTDNLCLPYLENEHAIARPVVTKEQAGYRMVYSARRLGETYRIYTASSADGLNWIRDPHPLLDVAPAGWDSEMVCYGCLLPTPGATYLLYNGNAYGRDGFGAACLE